MLLACKKIRENEPAWLPVKREEDSDYDLFTSTDIRIPAGQVVGVRTNLAIEYPDDWEGKIEDKSGLALKGLTVFGGVIDGSYTGEHIIVIFNASGADYTFKAGHKVAQLKLRKQSPHFAFGWVDRELRVSTRGTGGFGSTGV